MKTTIRKYRLTESPDERPFWQLLGCPDGKYNYSLNTAISVNTSHP